MKLKVCEGRDFIPETTRECFESTTFIDLGYARHFVQGYLPNHFVSCEGDRIVVTNRDRSLRVAQLEPTINVKHYR